jgi:hypothetical protein
MDAIVNHPANAKVIRSLCQEKCGAVSIVAQDRVDDPYYKCGSHPEIVERVWDHLGAGMTPECRYVLCGTPVLVDPNSGVIVAVAYGTAYCLRLPEGVLPAALEAGCEIQHHWTEGYGATDLSDEFGPNWVFGHWGDAEKAWCDAAGNAYK